MRVTINHASAAPAATDKRLPSVFAPHIGLGLVSALQIRLRSVIGLIFRVKVKVSDSVWCKNLLDPDKPYTGTYLHGVRLKRFVFLMY